MIMHTAMSEAIPLPEPDIIRRYMSKSELTFQGEMCRGPALSDSSEGVASGNDGTEPVTVRRFLSLDAVRPKTPRRTNR
jgi:hypothetical protein